MSRTETPNLPGFYKVQSFKIRTCCSKRDCVYLVCLFSSVCLFNCVYFYIISDSLGGNAKTVMVANMVSSMKFEI